METTWWTQPSELDQDQKRVVALPLDGNHLVIGPPGSGKTNLLVLRATYLYRANVRDTVILTFGRVLREFLASGSSNYDFASDKVQTYVRWAAGVLGEYGIKIDDSRSFSDTRDSIRSGFEYLFESGKSITKFDCILIDEAQDYTAFEIAFISKIAKSVFAVGDDRQRIYQTDGALKELEGFCKVSTLSFHYRNGIRICRAADGILDQLDSDIGLETSSQYDEDAYPSTVADHGGLSIDEQTDIAISEIATQLRAYPGEAIGVLCPRHEELDRVIALLEQSEISMRIQIQRHSDGYFGMSPERPIIVTTIHSAKGLEFRALHLLGMDFIKKFKDAQKRLAFTAVTRAKTSLGIYHQKDLPGYLERGLVAIEPEADPPSLSDLFPGRA